jgi:hypothetical protein
MKPILVPLAISLVTSLSPAASLTGTWSYGSAETGGGELKLLDNSGVVRFQLTCYRGGPSYNSGFIEGEFKVQNRVGVFQSNEFGPCRLTFTFKGNKVTILQSGKDSDCGFGGHVYADGLYVRISKAAPKFERPGL